MDSENPESEDSAKENAANDLNENTGEPDDGITDDTELDDSEDTESGLEDGAENEDEILYDGFEDVILEDMDDVSTFSLSRTSGYEAIYVYRHPGEEDYITEEGTFEEMWSRCYEEGVGTVILSQDIVAHEITKPNGEKIVGFGYGEAFTNGGSIRMPYHKYSEGTEGYSWPRIDLNTHTLDVNHSANDVQFDTGEAVYWGPGCWGNINNGKIINSSKSALIFESNDEGERGRAYLEYIEIVNCYSQYGGGIYSNKGMISSKDLRIHDCGSWYDGGAVYLKQGNIGMFGEEIYVYDNFLLTSDVSYGAPTSVGNYIANNLHLGGNSSSVYITLENSDGVIGINTKRDIVEYPYAVRFDSTAISMSSSVEFKSDDSEYVITHSSDIDKLFIARSDDIVAQADAYWCLSEHDPEESRFYGTIQEVWDYACEKNEGNVILKKSIYRRISNEPGAPDFPVFGWGKNFTEDGAFLVKNNGNKVDITFSLCNHQVNGLYSGNVPDKDGIGHVFVVDGSNGYTNFKITGWNNTGGTYDDSVKPVNDSTQGIIRNTGESAVWIIGEDAHLNMWQVAFDSCYGTYGGAIRVDGGTLDGGIIFIQQCVATESGGAIYCNSTAERTAAIYSREEPVVDTGKRQTYKGMYMMSGWTVKNNIRIDSEGNKIANDNIHLCLDNKMAWAPPMKYNIGINAEMKEYEDDFPHAEIAFNLGVGELWDNHQIVADDNDNYHAGIYDTRVIPSRGWNGDNFLYYTERFEAYGSTNGWDIYDYVGTFEEVWNWAAQQGGTVYVAIDKLITAEIRNESGYPDYPVFGMGSGFSETGELVVNNGSKVWLHLKSGLYLDRNMQGYETAESGFGIVTIKRGGFLKIQCFSGGSTLKNCASSAVRVEEGGQFNASALSIINSKAVDGAGIWNQGKTTLNVLLIHDNVASNSGGGVYNDGTLIMNQLGNSTINNNTSGVGNKLKNDNIYSTSGHYVEATGKVGIVMEGVENSKRYISVRSEDADNNKEVVAVKNYFALPAGDKPVEQDVQSDNPLIAGFKQVGDDLVFDLSREPRYVTNMDLSCFIFDGSSWYEIDTLKDDILMAQFNDDDGYLYYVNADRVSDVYKDWGFDVSSMKDNEFGFGVREDNGTDTITNTIKPVKYENKMFIPVGVITEFNYHDKKLKLYYTPSYNVYDHKEINYADLSEFRVDGLVQVSIVDRRNNIKKEVFGLDQPYNTTVDWLDGYEWFVYYLNGLPFNESLLTKTYDGFKLNIDMKSVPYPLMIRESEAKRVFNVLLKANVDGSIKNFDRLPEISGPKLYNGQAQFYISSKVLDDYLGAFGYESSEYNGEKIFGYKLKGSNEIIPLDIVKSEDGDWEFLLPNPDNDPYGFDDGELYLYSRDSDDTYHVGESFPDEISFYSVRIDDIAGRNDWHYTDLSTTYYVATNDSFHISLPTRPIGQWECNVDCDMRLMAGNMYMSISIDKVSQPAVISCGENGGMTFTVQYYGALEQLDYLYPGDEGYDTSLKFTSIWGTVSYNWNTRMINGKIDVIDTSGRRLPQNNQDYGNDTKNTKQLVMNKSGSKMGYFQSSTQITPLNKEKEYVYEATPSLSTVLRTYRGSHYEITELWVLKNEDDIKAEIEANKPVEPEESENPDGTEGSDNNENPDNTEGGDSEGDDDGEPEEPEPIVVPSADSTNRDDWIIYTREDLGVEDFSHVQLMNIPTDGHDGVLQIREGDVLRFIYTPVESVHEADVRFYDYDITDGWWYPTSADADNGTNRQPMSTFPTDSNTTTYLKTINQGINSPINYQNSEKPRYHFGNANSGAANIEEIEPKIYMNQANSNPKNGIPIELARGCCFGIAIGLDNNNHIIYNENISVPSLFDEDTSGVLGKDIILDYKLQFKRSGDVFTLTGVKDDKGNQQLSNLDKLGIPQTYNYIWTNNFYPLDSYVQNDPNGHDPMFGKSFANGKGPQFYKEIQNSWNNNNLPASDDGQNHNHYFGMHYEIRFRMPEDYIGPMEYVFFGDDDLWIFLDDQLVMDIGGVHSSAGEYLNLWDYIEQGDTSEHKLSVFYTERGASGSTCYMRFIIPNARFMDMGLSNMAGAIYLEKSAVAARDTKADYNFSIKLKNPDGTPYEYVAEDGTEGQPYIIYDSKNNVSRTGFITGGYLEFTLKDMESILIPGVKQGTLYEVEEEVILEMDTWVQKYGSEAVRQHWIEGVISGMSVEDILYTNTWKEDYVASGKLPDTGGNLYYGWIIGLGILLIGSSVLAKYNKR